MRLFGKRPVNERLKANPQTIRKIFIERGFSDEEILKLARKRKIFVEKVDDRRFYKLTRGLNTQGIVAEAEDFFYDDFDELISLDDPKKPVLVFLDEVTDPQNLGSIMRTLSCLGGFCIILPKRDSVGVNETVLRVASGAENYIPVCQVSNLSNAIQKAKKAGYWIAATVVEKGQNPRSAGLRFPLGIIFGSEGEGIRLILERQADYRLTLPMKGAGLSFNVAIAAAVFCYEIASQRH